MSAKWNISGKDWRNSGQCFVDKCDFRWGDGCGNRGMGNRGGKGQADTVNIITREFPIEWRPWMDTIAFNDLYNWYSFCWKVQKRTSHAISSWWNCFSLNITTTIACSFAHIWMCVPMFFFRLSIWFLFRSRVPIVKLYLMIRDIEIAFKSHARIFPKTN